MTGQETPPAPRWTVDEDGGLVWARGKFRTKFPVNDIPFTDREDAYDALVAAVTDAERLRDQLEQWKQRIWATVLRLLRKQLTRDQAENARLWEFVRAYDEWHALGPVDVKGRLDAARAALGDIDG